MQEFKDLVSFYFFIIFIVSINSKNLDLMDTSVTYFGFKGQNFWKFRNNKVH